MGNSENENSRTIREFFSRLLSGNFEFAEYRTYLMNENDFILFIFLTGFQTNFFNDWKYD